MSLRLALRTAVLKLPVNLSSHRFTSRAFSAVVTVRRKPATRTSIFFPLAAQPLSRFQPPAYVRENTTSTREAWPLTDRLDKPDVEPTKRKEPCYELTFTCKPCLTRSRHNVTKHGYHKGTVLITCPNCKNRHIISDHLKIFGDESMTIERLLAERGESFKKGILSEDGDMEIWDDGTTAERDTQAETQAGEETQAAIEVPYPPPEK